MASRACFVAVALLFSTAVLAAPEPARADAYAPIRVQPFEPSPFPKVLHNGHHHHYSPEPAPAPAHAPAESSWAEEPAPPPTSAATALPSVAVVGTAALLGFVASAALLF